MRAVPLARRLPLLLVAIGLAAVLAIVLATVAGDDDAPTAQTVAGTVPVTGDTPSAEWPALLVRLVADAEQYRWITTGDDLIEVWVCHVPDDTEAGIYAGLPLRLPLTAKEVTDIIRSSVPQYFQTISHGLYRPLFRVGGEVTMDVTIELAPGPSLRQLYGPWALVALALGGALVGAGTRMAGGCTSGHGLSGCARLVPSSLIATGCFMAAAVATSLLLKGLAP